jgi:hypothetical protein
LVRETVTPPLNSESWSSSDAGFAETETLRFSFIGDLPVFEWQVV